MNFSEMCNSSVTVFGMCEFHTFDPCNVWGPQGQVSVHQHQAHQAPARGEARKYKDREPAEAKALKAYDESSESSIQALEIST